MPRNNGFTETPFINDTLLASDDFYTESRTVAVGNVLTRGQLLGRITATGEVVAHNPNATDGSQNIYGILAEDVDTTAGAYAATVYLAGAFKAGALIPPVLTDAVKDALRAINIYTYPAV